MKRLGRWVTAAACACLAALTNGTARASDARSWHWTYVTQNANGPPFVAQSTVAIRAATLNMTYSVPLQKRQVVIESCTADLHDVLDASTVRNAGTTYFLIRFKPSHGALCGTGRRSAVALPADDYGYVANAAAAVSRFAGTVDAKPSPAAAIARAATPAPKHSPAATAKPAPLPTGKPTPAPSPSGTPSPPPTAKPTPEPSVTPSPSPSPARPAVQDWVENDGLFWFVRIRNISRATLTPAGEVFDCRNVGSGCGPFMRTVVEPGGTATVAAITAADRNTAPLFGYRYDVGDGANMVAGAGASTKRPPLRTTHMSARELRAAQALALGQVRAPQDGAPIVPAKLVKRGSSRLAIGETGTAVMRLMIAADGTPQEVAIVSITNKALTAAAIETAVSSTYTPATQNGQPIVAKYIATFSFDGQDPALSSIPIWKRPPSPTPAGSPAQSPDAPASAASSPPR